MIIEQKNDCQLITLSKAFDNRPKILNIFYSVSLLSSGILLLYAFLNVNSSGISTLIILSGIVGCFLAGYRFGNKALMSERIFINDQELVLIKQGVKKVEKSFILSMISNFKHLDKPDYTKHPLAGNSMDYLGFQTEQQVINEMYGDNRLSFDYNGKVVTFGENIYSWEFDELKQFFIEKGIL